MISPVFALALLGAPSWSNGCDQPIELKPRTAEEAALYLEIGEREIEKGEVRSAFFAFREALRSASLSEEAKARASEIVELICEIHGPSSQVAKALLWVREGQFQRALPLFASLEARAARLGVKDHSLSSLIALGRDEAGAREVWLDETDEPQVWAVVGAFGQVGYDSNVNLSSSDPRSDGLLRTGFFAEAAPGVPWARVEARASMDKHLRSHDLDALDLGSALYLTWIDDALAGSVAYDVEGFALGWSMSVLGHGPRLAVSYEDATMLGLLCYGLTFQHGFDESTPAFARRHFGSLDWTYRPWSTASRSDGWGRWATTATFAIRYLIIRETSADPSERFLEHQPTLSFSVSPSRTTRLSAGVGVLVRRFDASADVSSPSSERRDFGMDGYLLAEWDATESTTFFWTFEGRKVRSNIAAWTFLDVVTAVGVRWGWGTWAS
ncbi:MAG: hypothetical protein IPK13_24370 [Deltaproteobacteria bacterium]|nr:hypothetical protein [Deltaproteobacteria bacterium]